MENKTVEWIVRGVVGQQLRPVRPASEIDPASSLVDDLGLDSLGFVDLALALERELQQRLFEGEDAAEGLAAYVQKRSPQFTGK